MTWGARRATEIIRTTIPCPLNIFYILVRLQMCIRVPPELCRELCTYTYAISIYLYMPERVVYTPPYAHVYPCLRGTFLPRDGWIRVPVCARMPTGRSEGLRSASGCPEGQGGPVALFYLAKSESGFVIGKKSEFFLKKVKIIVYICFGLVYNGPIIANNGDTLCQTQHQTKTFHFHKNHTSKTLNSHQKLSKNFAKQSQSKII